jgi:YidC/Oxa1 family membrane protein insertase
MPNIRVMLWAALAAILFLNYEAWMQDYPASPATGAPASSTTAGSNAPANKLGDSVPQAAAPSAAAPAAANAETAAAPLGGAPMPAPVDAESPKRRCTS